MSRLATLRRAPFLLALLLVGVLAFFRNDLAVPPIESAAERVLSNALGSPVRVGLGRLRGTWYSNITLEDLVIRIDRGALRDLTAERIRIDYTLGALFSGTVSRAKLEGFDLVLRDDSSRRGGRPDFQAGELLSRLDALPVSTEIEAALRVHFLEGDAARLAAEVKAVGSLRRGLAVTLGASFLEPQPLLGSSAHTSIRLTITENSVIVAQGSPLFDHGGTAVSLQGSFRLPDDGSAPSRLRTRVALEGARLRLEATETRAQGSLDLGYGGRRRWLLPASLSRRFTKEEVLLDSLSVDARLQEDPGSGSLLNALLFHPRRLAELDGATVRTELQGASVGDLEEISLIAEGAFNGTEARLRRMDLQAAGNVHIAASGGLNTETGALEEAEVAVELPSLARIRPLLLSEAAWVEQLAGSFSGRARLSGTIYQDNPGALLRALSGELEMSGEGLLVAGLAVDEIQLRARLEGSRVDVTRFEARRQGVSVTTRSTLLLEPESQTVTIRAATLSLAGEPAQEFTLSRPTRITLSPETVRLDETVFSSALGRIEVGGNLDAAGIHATFLADRLPVTALSRLAGIPGKVGGTLSVEGSVDGELDTPTLFLSVVGDALSYRGEVAEVRLEFAQDSRSAILRELDLTAGDSLSLSASGRLPVYLSAEGVRLLNLRSSTLSLSGSHSRPGRLLPEEYVDYLPTQDARLEMELAERSGDLRVAFSVLARGGVDGKNGLSPFSRLSVSARLREIAGDRLRVTGEAELEGESVARWDGEIAIPGLSEASPILNPERLQLRGKLELALPLGFVAPAVPPLVYAGGRLNGDIALQGTVSAPTYRGTLIGRGVEFRIAGPLPPIEAVSVEAWFDQEALHLTEIRGDLGRAPFSGSGVLTFPGVAGAGPDRAAPSKSDPSGQPRGAEAGPVRAAANTAPGRIEFNLGGKNLLLYTDPTLRIRGDANIDMRGPLTGPVVAGTVTVSEARYEENIPLINVNTPPTIDREALQLFSFPGDLAAATNLDLSVEADRSIVVENNLVDTRLSLDLHLGGTLAVPVMTGRIFTREAAVRLPVTTVTLNRLALEFPRNDPFSPTISAQGQSQIRGYELFLTAGGPLPSVEVEVSSTPPLPREEALLLLTTGYADLAGIGVGERAVRTLGRFVGRQLLEVLLGESIVEEALVERVELRVGRVVSASGAEVIEVEFQLSEEDRWFLAFERDRYDEYNLGLAWRVWFN